MRGTVLLLYLMCEVVCARSTPRTRVPIHEVDRVVRHTDLWCKVAVVVRVDEQPEATWTQARQPRVLDLQLRAAQHI